MMKLYKENGTSPFGACLPSLLQMPFLIVLYSLIRGLSNVVPKGQTYTNVAGATVKCTQKLGCAAPRYIPTSSQMHQALVSSHGQMHWWFGMDLSSLPFSHHAFPGSASQAVLVLPYLVLIGAAMFLQYYQMKQMNSRNPQAAAANPQMQQMQKFFPIIFGVIYLRVPAGATIYMVISSAMRIGTQEFMFRSGMVTPVVHEREIGATKEKEKEKPPPKAVKKTSTATDGTAAAKATLPPAKNAAKSNGAKTNGRATTNGRKPAPKRATNGKAASTDDSVEDAPAPKSHPRSRAKRTRKAR
jgi:YidC/Oxa1 family membrane protein insertase